MVARTAEDILAARGVKPCLSPNLDVLATVEALGVKKLLFIGVGCQARVLRLHGFMHAIQMRTMQQHCATLLLCSATSSCRSTCVDKRGVVGCNRAF